MNLATGESKPPSSVTLSHTRPLAPSCLARSVRPSSLLRPYSAAPPGTRMPFTAGRPGERLEPALGEHLGQLDQLHGEAQIGLVHAVAVHGLVPRHARDLGRPLPRDRLGGVEHRLADGGQDVVLVDEAHLGVELHELVLAIGPQVLVAQAAGDLVVAVEAAHHQQLLEQLRALGQGVERAGRLPRRHEELAGPFRRGGHEHRRLDLDEALALHGRPDGGVDRCAGAKVALHALTAHVEVAVAEADGLVDVVGAGVDRERRRLGRAQHLDLTVAHLDLARRQVRVHRALGSEADGAGDAKDVLAAQIVGAGYDALHDAGVVAQVDEGEVLAVLAPARHPAAQHDLAAGVGRPQRAAQVGPVGGLHAQR